MSGAPEPDAGGRRAFAKDPEGGSGGHAMRRAVKRDGAESGGTTPRAEKDGRQIMNLFMVLLLVGVFVLARQEFIPVPTADDMVFRQFREPFAALTIANDVNGRFVSAALIRLMDRTGADYHLSLLACNVLAILAFCFLGWTFCRLLMPDAPPAVLGIAGLLIVLHPYATTFFDNDINQPNALLALGGVTLAIVAYARLTQQACCAVCIPLLAIVAASYQTTTYFFMIFVVADSLFRAKSSGEAVIGVLRGFLVLGLALVLYFAAHKALLPSALQKLAASDEQLLRFAYSNNDRSGLKDLAELPEAIFVYLVVVLRSLVLPEPVLPPALKAFIIGALGCPILVWATSRDANEKPFAGTLRLRICLLLLMLLLIASPIHVLLRLPHLPPRTLMHAGATLATLYLFAWTVSSPRMRPVVVGAGSVIVAALAWLSHDIARDQQRVLARDVALATEIAGAIDAMPGATPESHIAVVGRIPRESTLMDGIVSYYAIKWSRFTAQQTVIPILSEAAGRRLEIADLRGFPAAAALCAKHAPFTGLYLLLMQGRDIVLCLEDITYYPPYADPSLAPAGDLTAPPQAGD